MKKHNLWSVLLPALVIFAAQPAYGSILIGRVTYSEGSVFTYGEEEDGWVEVGQDAPVGAEDGFYTEEGGRAEMVFPNDTMLRMGEMSEVEVLKVEQEVTEVFVRSGIVRVYCNSDDAVFRVETPMGYVEVPPKGVTDIYVGDRTTEIVAIEEDSHFHKTVGTGARETYEVRGGHSSLIVSVRHVESGTPRAEAHWDRWCMERDMTLNRQARSRSDYLPSTMQCYSYELEPYGGWERLKYRGYYYWFWHPIYVDVGWAPFTVGRWARWHHEYVWISAEPWGWCTSHYGDWVYLHGRWQWTPYIHMGVSFPGIRVADFHIHFGISFRPHWHPGRVAWISTPLYVGWIPLAPWETYHGRHPWGPRTVVVRDVKNLKTRNQVNHYAYLDHSVVVSHRDFGRVSPKIKHDYNKLKAKGINKRSLLEGSTLTYGRHKMAEVKQDVVKTKRFDRVARKRTEKGRNPSGPETVKEFSRERTISASKRVGPVKAASSPPAKAIRPSTEGTRQERKGVQQDKSRTTSSDLTSKARRIPDVSTVTRRRRTQQTVGDDTRKRVVEKRIQKDVLSMRSSPAHAGPPSVKAIGPSTQGSGEKNKGFQVNGRRSPHHVKSNSHDSPPAPSRTPLRRTQGTPDYSGQQGAGQAKVQPSAKAFAMVPRTQGIKKAPQQSNTGSAQISQPSRDKWKAGASSLRNSQAAPSHKAVMKELRNRRF